MNYTPIDFKLPEVPGISKEQIALHLALYKGYVTHVNLLITQMNTLAQHGEDFAYAISELRRRLGFEWNGMRLHELYFESLAGGATILRADTKLYEALAKQYGSFSQWMEIFNHLSARGPGWAILAYDPVAKHFFHVWASEHDIGHLASLPILIAVDHWEHAYLKDYAPSEKGVYVDAYLKALDWEKISERFDAIHA